MDIYLPDEVWFKIISQMDPLSVATAACVSTTLRDVAREAMCGVVLRSLPRICNQGELCSALALSPEEARRLPHTVETRNLAGAPGYYDTHVFELQDYLPSLLEHLDGWPGLRFRLDVAASKKRKRIDLQASAKRRRALDGWMASEQPLGAELQSTDAWIEFLQFRGANRPESHKVLRAFLGNDALNAPPISEVKKAVVDFHTSETQRIENEAKKRAVAEARKAEVVSLVVSRGYEFDEELPIVRGYACDEWRSDVALMAENVVKKIKYDAKKRANAKARKAEVVSLVAARGYEFDEELYARCERRSNVTLIAEDMMTLKEDEKAKREQAAVEKGRRTELQRALRKRKLKRASDPTSYDEFVNHGQTAAGLTTIEAVVNSIDYYAQRVLVWDDAINVDTLGYRFGKRDLYCRTGAMEEGGPPMAIEEIVRALGERHQAEEAVRQERHQAEEAARREQEAKKRRLLALKRAYPSHCFTRRQCSTPTCNNQHRAFDPAVGPNGPVCGGCERGVEPRPQARRVTGLVARLAERMAPTAS